MKRSLSVSLAAAASLALIACDDGAATAPKTGASQTKATAGGSAIGGLIAARNEDVSDSAAFVILRPGKAGEPWSSERVQGPKGPADLWVGKRNSDGSSVFRTLDVAHGPLDTALRLVPHDEVWRLEPIEGLALADCTWPMRTKDGAEVPATKSYQLATGNVFHKAMWFEPVHGEPGILTISANVPKLAIWRKGGAGWTKETLWTAVVGDVEQRLRDVEVGDVDGDGQDELVVVTHDRGGVYVLEQTPEGLVAERIASTDEAIWIHEVEIGQADGDAALEFFTTPSEPNRFDGKEQRGRIDRYDFVDGKYVASVIEDDPASHAKEILACDIDGDGRVEIFAALEAKELRPDMTSNYPGYLNMYAIAADGKVTRTVVGDLIGAMCRFLSFGDTDGDGVAEIVASTSKDGILSFQMKSGAWQRRKVAGGFRSSGFEHATNVVDVTGDGILDIVAGSDIEQKYSAFSYDAAKGRWEQIELCKVDIKSYLTWGLMPLPAGR
jgi:hypothetical protein